MSRRLLCLAMPICFLALAATACSEEPTAKEGAATSAAPSVSAVATTQLTREQGAARYLQIVSAHNEDLDKCLPVLNGILDAQIASAGDLRKLRTACADIADSNRQFANDLTETTWPGEAQAAADQLVDELRADQLAWQEIVDAHDEDDVLDPKYPLTEDGPGADLLRAHLGLPATEDIEGA